MSETFIATAAFGLEGVAAGELRRMGLDARAENGGAWFGGTLLDGYRANLLLRTADRVLLVLAQAEARTFEALFQLVKSVAWERYLPRDAAIHVSGKCVRSQLMSVRDCQAVSKKAIVTRVMNRLGLTRLPETGEAYSIEVALAGDVARVTLDLSGDALNKRGYRTWNGEAPLRETLAAALVELSPWRRGMRLYDPCCGTGTLLIETALKAVNRPAGIRRDFACERYAFMPRQEMKELRRTLQDGYDEQTPFCIEGSDLNPEAVELCRRHVRQAGFEGRIAVSRRDLRTLEVPGEPGVFLLNPPYGERLSDQKSARELYREIGRMWKRHPGWKLAAITADPAFERFFGRRADKKRRLYNGRLECDLYVYGHGPEERA